MNKYIITTICVLVGITAILAAVMSVASAKSDKGGKNENSRYETKLEDETGEDNADYDNLGTGNDSEQLGNDSEQVENGSEQVENGSAQVENGSAQVGNTADGENGNGSDRYEVSRTRCEDCGYDIVYYVVEYSDGTTEIIDEVK